MKLLNNTLKIVSLVFFISTNAFATSLGNPKISVAESTYNFGSVSEGMKVEHNFTISNSGNAVLKIKQIITSCGCTIANAEKKSLNPGESTVLKTIFNTKGFSGSKYRTIHIYTNDLGMPEKVLTLKGEIINDIIVNPSRLNFGIQWYKNIRERKAFQDVTLQVNNPNAKILDIYNLNKYLDVQILSKTDSQALARVYLRDTIPAGEFRDRLVVNFTNTSKRVVNIPVFARVQGDVFLTPSTVSFGVLEGNVKERIVRVSNLSSTPLAIEKVKVSDSAIQTKVIENEKGKNFDIVLKVNPKEISDDIKAVVKIYTDNEDYEELSLGVYGIATQ